MTRLLLDFGANPNNARGGRRGNAGSREASRRTDWNRTVELHADLTGTRAVNDSTANNVAQVVIHGGERHLANDADNMPAFGSTYSDAEIASVANYVTARFGAKGSDLTAAHITKLRAED